MKSRFLALGAFFVALPAFAQNTDTQVLVTLAGAAASTLVSTDLPNNGAKGVQVGVNLTTMTSATVVAHVQGKDNASGVYYDILVGPSLTTSGFTNLTVYPGIIGTSNSVALPLPKTWRIEVVVTGGSASVSGTVGASVIQ